MTPYTFAPTRQPKYSCNSDVNFQTEGEKACGFRNLTEQPFCREKKKETNKTLQLNRLIMVTLGKNLESAVVSDMTIMRKILVRPVY